MSGVTVEEAKSLIAELCSLFYSQGWVSGTGGGISVRAGEDRIVMAPSGVQKERMQPSDMFVLDGAGNVVEAPTARPPPYPAPKLSECSPLFMAVSTQGHDPVASMGREPDSRRMAWADCARAAPRQAPTGRATRSPRPARAGL
jgi:hypothetical protein